MAVDLKKKVGPLPVWAWALLGLAATGYVIYARSRAASVDQSPTDSGQDLTPSLDPTTGLPSAGSAGDAGGTVTTPTTPAQTLSGEIGDITGLLSQLQGLPGYGATGPITVPPGATLYDPGTGISITAPGLPGGAPAPAGAPTKTKTNVDKALARVAQGKGGARTIQTLLKAGYSKGQITHAQATKQHPGQPHGHAKAQHKPAAKKSSVAPTHVLQHVTAAPSNHGKVAPAKTRLAPAKPAPKPKPKAKARR